MLTSNPRFHSGKPGKNLKLFFSGPYVAIICPAELCGLVGFGEIAGQSASRLEFFML